MKKRIVIDASKSIKGWENIEAHRISFGHLPDASCRSDHPLECNKPKNASDCTSHTHCKQLMCGIAGHIAGYSPCKHNEENRAEQPIER